MGKKGDGDGEAAVEKAGDKKKWLYLAPIAKPLASKKLNKKALKLVKKGACARGV